MDKMLFDSLAPQAQVQALHGLVSGTAHEAAGLAAGKITDPNDFLTALAVIETLLMRLTGLSQDEIIAIVAKMEAEGVDVETLTAIAERSATRH
jgi:hypothetical protein